MDKEQFYTIVGKDRVAEIVENISTPCFVYFTELIHKRLSDLKSCLPDRFQINYALKANPDLVILRTLMQLGVGADVSSLGELMAALAAGITADKIEFTGPGKTESEINHAVNLGISSINVESLAELHTILRITQLTGRHARVGIRVNLGQHHVESGLVMGGDTQFGIPQQQIGEALDFIKANSDKLFFTGIHVHSGSQILSADSLILNYTGILDFALHIKQTFDVEVQKINFGGGWGVKYFSSQKALDFDQVREGLRTLFENPKYSEIITNTNFIVEPGRLLVAECGIYVTTVLYRKSTPHKSFLIVDGGMHQHYLLAGGMGQVIRRNFEIDVFSSCLSPSVDSFTYDIAGCLCTPQDILATNLKSNFQISDGNKIIFFNSGAYALSASPIHFLSHESPQQVFI